MEARANSPRLVTHKTPRRVDSATPRHVGDAWQDTLLRLLDKTHPNLKVCNCAGCGLLMAGDSEPERAVEAAGLTYVAGHALGRPYCGTCIRCRHVPSRYANLTPRQAAKLGRTAG